MDLKVAYIIGPYTGKSDDEVDLNIKNAERLAKVAFLLGYAVICPHMNSAKWERDPIFKDKYDLFIERDLELLRRSDLVFRVNGWEKSNGSKIETEAAIKWGKPIIDEEFIWELAKREGLM